MATSLMPASAILTDKLTLNNDRLVEESQWRGRAPSSIKRGGRHSKYNCIARANASTSTGHDASVSPGTQAVIQNHSSFNGTVPMLHRGIDTVPLSISSVTGKRILDFYSTKTSKIMPCFRSSTEPANPWLTEVMRLAVESPLIRHSVLALAGSHLAQAQQDTMVQRMATHYYVKTVSEVTPGIIAWMKGDRRNSEHLYSVAVLLAVYEHICGDSTAMLFHANAARELAKSLGVYDNPQEPTKKLTAMSLELDLLAQCHSILRLDNNEEIVRAIAQTLPRRLDAVRNYSTFGSAIGVTSDLLLLVPCIAMLAIERRRRDQYQTVDLHSKYLVMQQKLSAWRYPAGKNENIRDAVIKRGGAKITQYALQIFLETAYWHQHISVDALAELLEPFVAAGLLWLNDVAHTHVIHNLAVPLMILGASVRHAAQRAVIEGFLKGNSDTLLITRVREALHWVWENQTLKDVFGMPALEMYSAATGCALPI